MTGSWAVCGPVSRVVVAGPPELPCWWPEIAPRVPGAGPCLQPADGAPPDVSLPAGVTRDDARRRVCAAVHAACLRRQTLAVHGVAFVRDAAALLLLGGHGTGKSLAGLALAERGWIPAAGDVCLIRAGGGPARVAGGTSAYVVRCAETARWFPLLPLPPGSAEADIAGCLAPCYQPEGDGGARLAAVVAVSGGSGAGDCRAAPLGPQAAVSALCRASTYFLDKVLDDPAAAPLRLAEDPELCAQRVRLARLAAAGGVWHVAGGPRAVAAEAVRLACLPGQECAR